MSAAIESSLAEVLKIVGVDKVIWIDDDFSSGDPERQKLKIQELLNKIFNLKINPEHSLLSEVTYDLPEGVRNVKLEQILAEQVANYVAFIDSLTRQLPDEGDNLDNAVEELTPVQITALTSALTNVETMSFKRWSSQKTTVLPQCTERTLFLIDRQFSKEGLGDEGDGILMELKAQGKYHCIMLTRTKPEEGTELLRNKIVESSNQMLKLSDFSVMSKSQVGSTAEEATREFCQACRVVFTHRHCHKVAEKIGEVMKKSISSTIEAIVSHSVYDLDKAIYENSLHEGSSELDVLARILLLQQRVSAQQSYFSDVEIIPELGRLRALRAITMLSPMQPNDAVENRKLHQWKREEVFDNGDTINKLNSPLACGDIFQIQGTEKQFLLLVQPCDVMTRGDTGERKANEGIFVALLKEKPKKQGESARFYQIENLSDDGGAWYFDFLRSACVSLNVLELAVFHLDGLVQISKDQQESKFLLPGWKKRFQSAVNKIKLLDHTKKHFPKAFASLSLNDALPSRDGKWEANGNTWSFNFKRIGRIRSPYAEAIFGSFAAYHTRVAFDHDFTRGLTTAEEIGAEK